MPQKNQTILGPDYPLIKKKKNLCRLPGTA